MLKRTLMLGLAPSIALVALLILAGAIDVGPGALLAALIAGGGMWSARRQRRVAPVEQKTETVERAPVERRVLDELPDPVILVGGARQIVSANQAAGELFNIGAPGRDLALALRHPSVLDAVDAALEGQSSEPLEFMLTAGVAQSFEVQVAALPDARPEDEIQVVVLLHDVTAVKRAEEVRADFVANVSHELRSPLAALLGFIETLGGPAKDDKAAQERFLGIMNNEAQRMTRLIEDLLSLSRVEANEHVRPADDVDIQTVLGEVIDSFSTRCQEAGNTIELDIPDDTPHVVGDRDQLSQVFQNLVDNALKYGGPGKPVRITAAPVERLPETGSAGLAVTVQDQGVGIPADQIPRLTERFYRIDKGRSRSLGGTGLGLAIVKHIISRHRGEFTIASEPENGSEFTVTLPISSIIST